MPGFLVALDVAAGDKLHQDQLPAITEAMKMENTIRATDNGKIARIYARAGQRIAANGIMPEFGL